ncbi:hypothetical protein JHK85_025477 [Glycine max]|nr:hypothetical protein JHK85_025477 [Glycine max]
MESIGMPYGHIVIVLQALDLNELPKSLRLDRWSKEAREEIRCIFVGACNYWYSYLVARYATILDLSSSNLSDKREPNSSIAKIDASLLLCKFKNYFETTLFHAAISIQSSPLESSKTSHQVHHSPHNQQPPPWHHLKRPLHCTFRALSDKYDDVISLWFGSRLVVVSSQTLLQECFTKNDVVLTNHPHFLSGKHISSTLW